MIPEKVLDGIKAWGFLTAIAGTALSISAIDSGLCIYLFALVLSLFAAGRSRMRTYPFPFLLGLLLASLCVSWFRSEYFWTSARGLIKYLDGFVLLYAGIDVIKGRRELRWVVVTLTVAYSIAAFAALFQQAFGVDFVYWREPNIYQTGIWRLRGPFKHCNDFGTFLVPGISIAAALTAGEFRHGKRKNAVWCGLLFVLLAYCLLRTMSRGALVAELVALGFLALFFRSRWIFMSAAAMGGALVWIIPSTLSVRLRGLLAWGSDIMPERVMLIKTALKMIGTNPFFGLGLNTYSENFPKFKPEDYPAFMYAHNSYLQMAAESGIVGVALFVIFILAFLWLFVRSILAMKAGFERTLLAGIAAGVLGMLVNALFDSIFQATRLRALFWCLMGIGAALAYGYRTLPRPAKPRKVKVLR